MSKLDECVSEILRIEREDGPDAVSLAVKRAEEFLVPFSRERASFAVREWRDRLIAEIREKGPKPTTPLVDQIIEAIDQPRFVGVHSGTKN